MTSSWNRFLMAYIPKHGSIEIINTHLVTRVKNARKKNPTYRMNMQSKQRNEYKECMVSMMTNKTGPNGCEINFSNLKKRFTL